MESDQMHGVYYHSSELYSNAPVFTEWKIIFIDIVNNQFEIYSHNGELIESSDIVSATGVETIFADGNFRFEKKDSRYHLKYISDPKALLYEKVIEDKHFELDINSSRVIKIGSIEFLNVKAGVFTKLIPIVGKENDMIKCYDIDSGTYKLYSIR